MSQTFDQQENGQPRRAAHKSKKEPFSRDVSVLLEIRNVGFARTPRRNSGYIGIVFASSLYVERFTFMKRHSHLRRAEAEASRVKADNWRVTSRTHGIGDAGKG
jgi:hypothetical protein